MATSMASDGQIFPTKGNGCQLKKRAGIFMNKSLKVERSSDKAKPGHVIMVHGGYVKVLRGGKCIPWERGR